jgi:hypothetical protein
VGRLPALIINRSNRFLYWDWLLLFRIVKVDVVLVLKCCITSWYRSPLPALWYQVTVIVVVPFWLIISIPINEQMRVFYVK